MGIDVKDKIVLVRYGEIFRGLKVHNAQKRGANGILIFSDPADDGYAKGDTYPSGRFRPESAIQRGSVQFLSHGPGDPSTPFGPSIAGAKRLPMHLLGRNPSSIESGTEPLSRRSAVLNGRSRRASSSTTIIATIPSLPISYGTAREILKVLAGPNVPSGWQGGLPLPYHVGPGPAEVDMTVGHGLPAPQDLERDRDDPRHRGARPLGHDRQPPRRLGLRRGRPGQRHGRDAWRPAAPWARPSSTAGSPGGRSSTRAGTPRSTAWSARPSGPRPTPTSSKKKAVLMLNVDSAVSGHEVGFSGVPSLRDFVLEAAGSITDVRTGRTLRDLWTEARRKAWAGQSPLVLDDPAWNAERLAARGARRTHRNLMSSRPR